MNTSNHRSAGIVESISDLTVELFSPAQISFFVAGGGDCILVSSWIYQFIIVGVRRDHKSLLDGVLHQLGGPSMSSEGSRNPQIYPPPAKTHLL